MLPEKRDRELERLVRFRFAVGLSALTRKRVVGAQILVDRDERIGREPPLEQIVHEFFEQETAIRYLLCALDP